MDNLKVRIFIRYNKELTHEIEEFIDREAEMINRGRPSPNLDGNKYYLRSKITFEKFIFIIY
jgi:hypothetical protein